MNQQQPRTFKAFCPPIPLEQQAWRAQQNSRPLVLEIGPGVGLHPIQYAQLNPAEFVIGIERTTEKFNKFLGRVQHHPQITNLLAVHADAIEWISSNIQHHEVSKYFLLYPNPYPKAAQKNKRLMHMPFMHFLIDTMQIGASITLATNMHFFYSEAKQVWSQIDCFALIKDTKIKFGDLEPRTHFERKYLAAGQECYELVFLKTKHQ